MTNKQLATLMRFHMTLFMAGVDPRDSKKLEAAQAAIGIIEAVDKDAEDEEGQAPPEGEWRLIDLTGNALAIMPGGVNLVFIDPPNWEKTSPLAFPDELAAKRFSIEKNVFNLVKPAFFPRGATRA